MCCQKVMLYMLHVCTENVHLWHISKHWKLNVNLLSFVWCEFMCTSHYIFTKVLKLTRVFNNTINISSEFMYAWINSFHIDVEFYSTDYINGWMKIHTVTDLWAGSLRSDQILFFINEGMTSLILIANNCLTSGQFFHLFWLNTGVGCSPCFGMFVFVKLHETHRC